MMERYLLGLVLAVTLAGCNSDQTASDTTSPLTPVSAPVTGSQNSAPTIAGSPSARATVGTNYSFKPVASDPNGDALTFSIQNKPSWAMFDSFTGALSGTPGPSSAGSFAGIVISVSDGSATASLAPFSISVAASGDAPVISGSPSKSIVVGSAYSFTPVASDPTGQQLSFSIVNKPSWASFDEATGELSGTATAGSIGTTAGIVITVSNGTESASLPSFSISVDQTGTGSATLSWMPPAQNTDGTALTNLAGYRIYYGTSTGNLNKVIQVSNPGISSYVIANLSSATWYFSVKAYTASNVQSDFSKTVSKTVM